MKRLILIFVLASLVVAASASADEQYTPTCGQNAGKFAAAGYLTWHKINQQWEVDWSQNCGNQGTVEWEIQRCSSGPGCTWSDHINNDDNVKDDNLFTTPSGDANKNVDETLQDPDGGICTDHTNGYIFRLKVWDASGPSTVPATYNNC